MKSNLRRLSLSRETVRSLSGQELGRAFGAAGDPGTNSIIVSCQVETSKCLSANPLDCLQKIGAGSATCVWATCKPPTM